MRAETGDRDAVKHKMQKRSRAPLQPSQHQLRLMLENKKKFDNYKPYQIPKVFRCNKEREVFLTADTEA